MKALHNLVTDNVSNVPRGHMFNVRTSIGVISVKQIIISTYSYRQQIEEYINKRLKELNLKEYKPDVKIKEKDETTFVTCSLPEGIPQLKEQRYFKEYIIIPIAKAMVDIIQEEFAIDYANEILQTNHGFREIMITGMVEDKVQSKNLLDPIVNEIVENKAFCLDGWIRFRLSPYKMTMIEMVENLTCEYEAYKEYEEFISLIKSYVLDQPSLMDEVHIIPSSKGVVNLYNEEKEYMALDMAEYECRDDLILGTLLRLAPLNLIIHKQKSYRNTRLINTIKSIYEGRIEFCKGCKACNKLGFKMRIIGVFKEILTQKKV